MMLIVGRRLVIGFVGTTMAVAFDVAEPERLSLRAVTSTRKRKPRSAIRTPYVLPVAPMTAAHVSESTSQRCHWKAKVVGFPVHVPSLAVSSSADRIGDFLDRFQAQPLDLVHAPFHTEQLEVRRRDSQEFTRGLQRNGPRAVAEFASAEKLWSERARAARTGPGDLTTRRRSRPAAGKG